MAHEPMTRKRLLRRARLFMFVFGLLALVGAFSALGRWDQTLPFFIYGGLGSLHLGMLVLSRRRPIPALVVVTAADVAWLAGAALFQVANGRADQMPMIGVYAVVVGYFLGLPMHRFVTSALGSEPLPEDVIKVQQSGSISIDDRYFIAPDAHRMLDSYLTTREGRPLYGIRVEPGVPTQVVESVRDVAGRHGRTVVLTDPRAGTLAD
jgi:hypothetical protein